MDRDTRNVVSWWLPVIGGKGLLVYVYVAHRSNLRTGSGCFETVEHIATACGIGVNEVRRGLRQLTEYRLLSMYPGSRHTPNTYRPILPVTRPVGLTKSLPLSDSGLTDSAPLKSVGLTKSTSEASRNRETNSSSLTESDTARVREHLYGTLTRMNGAAPTPRYGRDGRQAKTHVAAHGVDAVLAKVDAFPAYWPTSWIANKTPGANATAPNFWTLFDEIPVRSATTAQFTPLSRLGKAADR